jgi:transposase-like protein
VAKKGERHWSKKDKAKAILECVSLGDAATCKKYSISPRTLQRWHQDFRKGTDAELTASVAQKKQAIDDSGLVTEIRGALASGLDFLRRAGESAEPSDPEAIHAVAGAVKIVSEVDGTYKMIDARIRGQAGGNGAAPGQVSAGSNVVPIRSAGS